MMRTTASAPTAKTTNDSMGWSRSSHLIGGHASGEGDGALSEEELYIDKHTEKEVYETPDATSIGKPDERNEREVRLQEVNEERDRYSDGFAERMHYVDRRRIIEALCSALPVSNAEQEAAISAFESIDLDQFGNQKAVEKVALATIRHVVDQRRVEHSGGSANLLRYSDEYSQVKDDVLPNDRGFMKLCSNVSDAIDSGPRFYTLIPGRDPNLPDSTRRRWDYPDEFWSEMSADGWEQIARNWTAQPEKFRKQMPDEYRELVEQLQHWEPWNEEEDEDEEASSSAPPQSGEETPPTQSEQNAASPDNPPEKSAEELLEELAEEVREDAESTDG